MHAWLPLDTGNGQWRDADNDLVPCRIYMCMCVCVCVCVCVCACVCVCIIIYSKLIYYNYSFQIRAKKDSRGRTLKTLVHVVDIFFTIHSTNTCV